MKTTMLCSRLLVLPLTGGFPLAAPGQEPVVAAADPEALFTDTARS